MDGEGAAGLELKVVVGDATRIEADALIVNLFEGVSQAGGATGAVDRALGGSIAELIAAGEIKGKLGENTLDSYSGQDSGQEECISGRPGEAVGVDGGQDPRATAEACRFARGKGSKRVATIVHGAGSGGIELTERFKP